MAGDEVVGIHGLSLVHSLCNKVCITYIVMILILHKIRASFNKYSPHFQLLLMAFQGSLADFHSIRFQILAVKISLPNQYL